MSFISVTDITNFSPTQMMVGETQPLTGTVFPANATNRTIEWSLVSGPGTVDRITGRVTATGSGNIIVRATVRNGVQQD